MNISLTSSCIFHLISAAGSRNEPKKSAEPKEILLIDEIFLSFFLHPALCPAAAGWLHYAMLEFLKYREIARDNDVIVWLIGDGHHHHCPGRERGILKKATVVFIKLLSFCYLVSK